MRKLMLAAAGSLTIAVGAPVMAQSVADFDTRIDRLQVRIQSGVESGRITRNEAQRLRGQLRDLRQLFREFRQDGLTAAERNQLQRRIDRLQERIRNQRRDDQRRDRDRMDDREFCPPGLAKKDPACIPPGQAKKMDDDRRDRDHRRGRDHRRDRDRDD